MDPTVITWVLVIWGVITLAPLTAVQMALLLSPHSAQSKEWVIGKDEDWRDRTHFRFALGAAWADWLVVIPLFVAGVVGMFLSEAWGYVLFGAAGAISLYINIILWFTEKEYVYPSRGPLKYFTYYWGFFVYWGAATLVYSALRVGGADFSICRSLQGSAFGALVTFFGVDGFEITKGQDKAKEFLSPMSYTRRFCSDCGSRVTIGFEKSEIESPMVGVYTTALDEVRAGGGVVTNVFEPKYHAFYADRLYDITDGKPKFVDMAAGFGGSGKMLDDHGQPV